LFYYYGEKGGHTLGSVEEVVAVLDGCQGVVDDGLVDLVGVAAIVHGCSEAVAELGGYVSGVWCGMR
jgi:hypothetical protein